MRHAADFWRSSEPSSGPLSLGVSQFDVQAASRLPDLPMSERSGGPRSLVGWAFGDTSTKCLQVRVCAPVDRKAVRIASASRILARPLLEDVSCFRPSAGSFTLGSCRSCECDV